MDAEKELENYIGLNQKHYSGVVSVTTFIIILKSQMYMMVCVESLRQQVG
jgi:hypothetical protein